MPKASRYQNFFTPQSWSAWLYLVLGILMIGTPYLVSHDGYTNSIVVAAPTLEAPFDKALILIGQHSIDSSIGIVLNKPLSESQHEKLSPFMRDSGLPISYGGPIEVSERIFVLEETPSETPGGKPGINLVIWDDAIHRTPDLMDKIRESLKKGEQRYRIFTGYAAWGPFQLENEILGRHSWSTVNPTHDVIFQNGQASHWEDINHKNNVPRLAPNQT